MVLQISARFSKVKFRTIWGSVQGPMDAIFIIIPDYQNRKWWYLWRGQLEEWRWERWRSSFSFLSSSSSSPSLLPLFHFFLSFSSSSLLSSQDLVLFTEIFTGITLFVLDVYFCYPIAVCWSVGNIIKYSEFWMSSIFYSIFAKLSENLVSCGADSETQDKIKL